MSSDTTRKVAPQPRRPRFTELRRGLVSAALGMGAFYGARYLGASPLDALLISTVVSALRAIYSTLRNRTFDPIAWFLMLADGITVAVALLTRSPVWTMLGQHIPGVVFEMFVLVGLAMNRPATESLVAWIRPGWVQQHITQHRWTPADAHAYHRMHMRLTLAVAALQLLHLIAATVVILTLSVDIAKGAIGLLALTTDIAVLVIALGGIGRFLLRHKARQGHPSKARGQSHTHAHCSYPRGIE